MIRKLCSLTREQSFFFKRLKNYVKKNCQNFATHIEIFNEKDYTREHIVTEKRTYT